jgi:peptidyl-prolyl cis-trans isomerase B (cyclophilin B)
MIRLSTLLTALILISSCNPRIAEGVRKNDLKKDVLIVTSRGDMIIRLSDSTPLHRNNFLKLVAQGYYDSVLFHRVIKRFMIQAGDPDSRHAAPAVELGEGGPGYTIPAEFNPALFHHRGVLAAARESDDVNPKKASSGSQFYIVQGRRFTDAGLDSVEKYRLKGRKIPAYQREVYKTLGGSPHLDMNYTIFGELIKGQDVLDSIASAATDANNRPRTDIRIIKMKLVKRSK